MEGLWQYHLLNLKVNVTAFGYCVALLHMTDNIGLKKILVSYSARFWYSILTIIYRIDFLPSKSWHMSSGIQKCWSAVGMIMILEGYHLLAPFLLQSLVKHAPSQTSIYLLDGKMFPQQKHMSQPLIVYFWSCSHHLKMALHASISHGCKLPAQK